MCIGKHRVVQGLPTRPRTCYVVLMLSNYAGIAIMKACDYFYYPNTFPIRETAFTERPSDVTKIDSAEALEQPWMQFASLVDVGFLGMECATSQER